MSAVNGPQFLPAVHQANWSITEGNNLAHDGASTYARRPGALIGMVRHRPFMRAGGMWIAALPQRRNKGLAHLRCMNA